MVGWRQSGRVGFRVQGWVVEHAIGQLAEARFKGNLAVITTQGIQFGCQAGEARVVVLKPAFNKVNVFGHIVFAAGLVGQKRFDNPSPVPWPTGLVVKKGSKALARVCGVMPVPSSLTSSIT